MPLTAQETRQMPSTGHEARIFIAISRSVALFVLSPVCVVACHSSVRIAANDLPGLYVVRTGKVTDTLRLEAAGLVHHRLWDESGLAVSESGNWKLADYPDGDEAVEFHGISPVADRPSPHASKPGWWLTRVGRDRGGRITLMLDRDVNLVYTRTD